ncbi:MAG: LamB/YcsF family protein, partial [Meiothermus silvanus]|nr:LamB/YcsF family protein [Allomeiothermus silvanus]
MHMDLNADAGESFGSWKLGNDEELFKYVTSANLACGFHAGDPLTLYKSVRLCKQLGVAVGAHPGFPDLRGFGRREMAAALLRRLGA